MYAIYLLIIVLSIVEYVAVNCQDLDSEQIKALATTTKAVVEDLAVAEGKKKKKKWKKSKKKSKKHGK